MDPCIVMLRQNKTDDRNGLHEVTRERATRFLSNDNLGKLVEAYFEPEDHPNIARLVDLDDVKDNLYNLSIPLYVHGQKRQGHGW